MTAYNIDADPYLSESTKQALLKHKAAGLDISAAEKFLRDTAPLMVPSSPTNTVYVLAGVCFALALVGALTAIIAIVVAVFTH